MPPVIVDVDRPSWQPGLYARGQVPRYMKDDRSLVRPFLEECAFALVRRPNSVAQHFVDLVSLSAHSDNSCLFLVYCYRFILPSSGASIFV
jgi:hypothetical protein